MQVNDGKRMVGVGLLIIYVLFCILWVIPKFSQQHEKSNTEPCILQIWHIDTAEGGSISRASWLKRIISAYEHNNKSTYVHISTLTYEQALLKVQNKESFDLLSFGVGVGRSFLDYIVELDVNTVAKGVRRELIEGGTVLNKLYAVAYMMGGYCLFTRQSSVQHLLPSDMTATSNRVNLIEVLTYNYAHDKKSKNVSCVTGYGKCNLPLTCLSLNTAHKLTSDNFVLLDNAISQYDAYAHFIDNDGTMLLGTQRDIYKLENRLSSGSVSALVYQPLKHFTDLVQYMAISAQTMYMDKCISLLQYLVSPSTQMLIDQAYMLSVLNIPVYVDGYMAQLQEALSTEITTINAFCDIEILFKQRQDDISSLQKASKNNLDIFLPMLWLGD
ncbi:MAG: hypothetical protein PHW00_05515 [Clostridia bacterium]|nr:hypothetical protein [Clostridia bacterium]MDD3832093.1 hypothetical protein [Clostridia bacterium]